VVRGANIPLFRSLGMDYYAIEGSPTIVKQLHQRYPEIANNIRIDDFTARQPFDGDFDLVIDRAALTHNSTASINNALQSSFDSLQPGGQFIGSDWFSKNHTDYSGGEQVDVWTAPFQWNLPRWRNWWWNPNEPGRR
jgi:SAM-dependent methyltransferase